MSPVPSPAAVALADGKRTRVSVDLDLDARVLAMAEPLHAHIVLGNAALHLADDDPNKGVVLLMGAALEATARADEDGACHALGAAIHLLRQITESQLRGVVL